MHHQCPGQIVVHNSPLVQWGVADFVLPPPRKFLERREFDEKAKQKRELQWETERSYSVVSKAAHTSSDQFLNVGPVWQTRLARPAWPDRKEGTRVAIKKIHCPRFCFFFGHNSRPPFMIKNDFFVKNDPNTDSGCSTETLRQLSKPGVLGSNPVRIIILFIDNWIERAITKSCT